MMNYRLLVIVRSFVMALVIACAFFLQACDREDPAPVNEEEVITTVEVALTPEGGGTPVYLRFFDEDGEHGSIAPEVTVSGSLEPSSVYTGIISLHNETVSPPVDISEEVAEEAVDHLFCFTTQGNLTVNYDDQDANGMPVGLMTRWETGLTGTASVTVALRHQDGVKTGQCPGGGETDVEVSFDFAIE
jgi:hypothetical protein